MGAFSEIWKHVKDTVQSFINDEALSRGAAIAFYTVTSIAPVLLIVIAIAGLAFGRDAAQNAITAQLSSLMGQQTADVLQSAVASAAGKSSGIVAAIDPAVPPGHVVPPARCRSCARKRRCRRRSAGRRRAKNVATQSTEPGREIGDQRVVP